MILFFSETNFKIIQKKQLKQWLQQVALRENKKIGAINFVFYNDEQLSTLNKQYLNHDTFTDTITFDYSENGLIQGDICISVERVKANAHKYKNSFEEELRRVMVHGVLHLCGYQDKNNYEKHLMKQKEEEALELFKILYNY